MKLHASLACSLLLASFARGADVYWTGGGGAVWSYGLNWQGGNIPVPGDVAIFQDVGGTVTVSDNRTIRSIRVLGPVNVTLTIASGATLTLDNSGGTGIEAVAGDITVNGPGQLAMSKANQTLTDRNCLDHGAALGRTLAINAEIIAKPGEITGLETYRVGTLPSGTIIIGYPDNAFPVDTQIGLGHTLSVPKLADGGQTSPLGTGPQVFVNNRSVLRYTGAGDTTDRTFILNGSGGGGIGHNGTGPLTWTGNIYNDNNSTQTLTLSGDSASDARIEGNIYNNVGTLIVRKEGPGTWVLAGSNTFTGGLTVNAGTLGLDSPDAFINVAAITMTSGSALSLNPSVEDGFSVTLPPVNASGRITLTIPPAATASDVTFSALSASQVDVQAPAAGTPANRIFIRGAPTGLLSPWLTLNGGLAQYDPVNGLSPTTLPPPTGNIATKDDTLPNGPTTRAVIDTPAYTGAPLALPADPTELYDLTQTVTDDDATVDLDGQLLALNRIAIGPGADALTLLNGTLTPPLAPAATDRPRIRVIRSAAETTIDPAKDYTHLLSFGATAATVNTVLFPAANAAAGTVAGTSYGWENGPGSASSGNLPAGPITDNTTDGLLTLVTSMRYSNNGAPSSITLTGLTDGESYELTFYSRHWNDFSYYRLANLTFITDGSGVPTLPLVFNTEFASVTTVTYRYTLTGTNAVTMTLSNFLGDNRTLHLYALSNERLPDPHVPDPSPPNTLILDNAGATPLTISATIADNANPANLVKDGDGEVRLTAPLDTTGTIALLTDGLVLDTPPGVTNTLAAMPYPRLTGPGGFTKDGPGTLSIFGANDYSGLTTVAQGTLRIGGGAPLGSGDVTVLDGAALDIGGDISNPNAWGGFRSYMLTGPRTVTIAGTGPDGYGAYVNNSLFNQNYATTGVTLSDDATVGSAQPGIPVLGDAQGRLDILAQGGTFRLNGHTLTKKANNLLGAGNGILDTTGGGGLDILQGTLYLHDIDNQGIASTILGDDTTTLNLADGTCLWLYRFAPAVPWTINVGDNARLRAYTQVDGYNTLSGPVTLTGDTIAEGNATLTLRGPVSGTGGIRTAGSGRILILANSGNTYEGPTILNDGDILAAVSNALSPNSAVIVNTNALLEVAYGTAQTIPSLTLNATSLRGLGSDISVTGPTAFDSKEFMSFAGILARQFETGVPLTLSSGFIASDNLTAQAIEKVSGATATLTATNITANPVTVSGGKLTLDDLTLEDVFRIGRPLLWYDTSDAPSIVTNENGNVISLRNKGSLANTDANATANTNLVLATAPNGMPVIRKETDPYAALVSASTIGITGTAPRTLIAAARRTRSDRNLQIHYGPNSGGQAFGFDISVDSNPLYYLLYSNDITVSHGGSLDFLVMTHMSGGLNNPMLRQAWLNGAFVGQNAGGTFNTTNERFYLFARNNSANQQGDIGEVFFFNRTLSDPERRAVERYLQRKWRNETPPLAPALAPDTDVTLVPTPQQDATTGITFPLDLATSGISTSKNYTHALDFGNNTGVSRVFNDVTFTPITGDNPAAGVILTATQQNNGNAFTTQIPSWSSLYALLLPMQHNGANPTAVTLTGLTPGKAYELAFFNRPWSSDNNFTNRRMIISFDNGTARDLLTFNNECSLVHAVTWRYVAVGDSVTVALFNVTGSQSRHFYALTNEELPPTAASGDDLLPLLDLGSRPETIRNLSGAGTVTGDGTVPITLTGEITPSPVINFDGAVPTFDGAVLPVSLTGGHIHVVGDADFSGLSVIAAPDANLRGAKIKILSATGNILALPQLDPPLQDSMRLEVSGGGHSISLVPVYGTILMIR